MMDYLQSLRIFVKVAEVGSFSGAANRMRVSSAAATRSVASLEERLDARLLQRSTRSVTLTEAGRMFLERITPIVADIDEVEGELLAATAAPSGTLRLAVSEVLGADCLARLLKAYTSRHPKVVPQVTFTDGALDLVERRFDAAITSDTYPHPNSVVTRRFGRCRMRAVAAPHYLAKEGQLVRPDELAELVVLSHGDASHGTGSEHVRAWTDAHWPHASQISANSSDMLRRMALEGMGVAVLPDYLVRADLEEGRLMQALPDLPIPEMGLSIAYASRRNLAPSVRTLVDFLVEWFQSDALTIQESRVLAEAAA